MMTPRVRKLALTVHVITSIGWFGAVAVFLVLALVGLTEQNNQSVRTAYLAMNWATSFMIVPLCVASLLSGIVSSLGTDWGLFRHYWVLIKLLVTAAATFVLFVHTQPINMLAEMAQTATAFSTVSQRMQVQMVVASGATLVVLTILTLLSIYKPRGLTPFGWRKQRAGRSGAATIEPSANQWSDRHATGD